VVGGAVAAAATFPVHDPAPTVVPASETTSPGLDPGVVWMLTAGTAGAQPPLVTTMTLDQLLSGGLR